MRIAVQLDEDIGPALLFDRASLERWRASDWAALSGPEAFRQEAEDGWCSFLYSLNTDAGFLGRVELYVDESPPESVRYAERSAAGLWLRAPTGRLVLHGAGSIAPKGTLEHSVAELDVPPGDCAVDLYAFEDHLQRLQRSGVPDAPPSTRWSRFLQKTGCLLSGGTLLAALAVLCGGLKGRWDSLKWVLVAVLAPWLLWVLARELTGEGRRSRERNRRIEEEVARLPPVPDILVVVRTGVPPGPDARGGGVGGAEGTPGSGGRLRP